MAVAVQKFQTWTKEGPFLVMQALKWQTNLEHTNQLDYKINADNITGQRHTSHVNDRNPTKSRRIAPWSL